MSKMVSEAERRSWNNEAGMSNSYTTLESPDWRSTLAVEVVHVRLPQSSSGRMQALYRLSRVDKANVQVTRFLVGAEAIGWHGMADPDKGRDEMRCKLISCCASDNDVDPMVEHRWISGPSLSPDR
jgi:hypothetical protein